MATQASSKRPHLRPVSARGSSLKATIKDQSGAGKTRIGEILCKEGHITSSQLQEALKSTTLYSVLNVLNKEDTKILTAEDPVEFNFKGINQVNVRNEVGMTFAAALKAFLRQDPEIIMVGEISYKTFFGG